MKKWIAALLLVPGIILANLEVGSAAPTIQGMDEAGKTLELGKLKGYVLVYFYPKADTPGCTAQACSLRDAFATLKEKGVTVIGVSHDNQKDQAAFKKKHKLPFSLIADTEGAWAKAFEVPMNGGFMSRQAFLIFNGTFVWIDRAASTSQQANDLLAVLKKRGV